MWIFKRTFNWKNILVPVVAISFGHFFGHFNFPIFGKKVIQVANPNRAQFTKCASYAIPSTTQGLSLSSLSLSRFLGREEERPWERGCIYFWKKTPNFQIYSTFGMHYRLNDNIVFNSNETS